MSIEPTTLIAITGMALVTYLTRLLGLVLISRVPLSGRVQAFLSAVPGAILMALVAPAVLLQGVQEGPQLAAACVTVAVAMKTKNMLLAMLAGIVCISLLRAVT